LNIPGWLEEDRSDPNLRVGAFESNTAAVLSFDIMILTPLLAVSKVMSQDENEALELRTEAIKRAWAPIVSAPITNIHVIQFPTLAFADFWSRHCLFLLSSEALSCKDRFQDETSNTGRS
jgi:hypothetical protein